MSQPPQQVSDQEVDLRTFLARCLGDKDLEKSLVEQVREYGKLYSRHMPFSISAKHMLDVKFEEYQASKPKLSPAQLGEIPPWEDLPDDLYNGAEPAPEPTPATIDDFEASLSDDQKLAWVKLKTWSYNDEPYFILRGFAGTGKTYLMKMLTMLPGLTFLFTAPTNKATKVIGKSVGRPAKTTYSTLGLKMEQDGEKMTLTYGENVPYIPRKAILVVDEASMVQSELDAYIEKTRESSGCKVLLTGDPAQLPPVGENSSRVWKRTDKPHCRAVLKKVMRFDNQLLTLSVKIRDCLKDKQYISPIEDDHDKKGGVYKLTSRQNFERSFLKDVESPKVFADRKIIAWRNKTVDKYNQMVRSHLGFTEPYCVGEQLMLADPVEYDGQIIASIDDEVTITSVTETYVLVADTEIPVYRMTVDGDVHMTLSVPSDPDKLARLLSRLASEAKSAQGLQRKMRWKEFWDVKKQFHAVRYSYAMTAHRAQGSTYKIAYVDQLDILASSDKRTAFRCLYVACTRPTTKLYTY